MTIYDLRDLLPDDLRQSLENVRKASAKIWENSFLQHFTRHDLKHSEKIIDILTMIFGSLEIAEKLITQHELFILLAAAYLHDIGMQSPIHAGISHGPPYDPEDGDLIREKHHKSSYDMIWKSVNMAAPNRIDCGLEGCTQPDYVRFIALLAKYHRMKKPGILSKELAYKDHLESGKYVRVKFLVALIRLADELDRDYMRVDLERLKLHKISTDSKRHWWIHHYTKAVDIKDGIIRILFRIPELYKESETELANLIYLETKTSVEQQFAEVRDVLWKADIRLVLDINPPADDPEAFSSQPTLMPIPEDLLEDLSDRSDTQKKAVGAGKKLETTLYLNGIMDTDDVELKRLTKAAIELAEKEEYAKAVEKIEQALMHTVKPIERVALNAILGNCLLILGKTKHAINNFNDILAMSEGFDNVEEKTVTVRVLNDLGNAYEILGKMDRCIKCYETSIQLAKEIGDRKGEVSALGNLGNVYSALGQVEKVADYYGQALTIASEIGDGKGEGIDLGNLGNSYLTVQRNIFERIADNYPDRIKSIDKKFWFHLEDERYIKISETERFMLYQVLPYDWKISPSMEGKPILIIPPYILGANILCFLPGEGRSYVHAFANQGIPTYIRIVKDIQVSLAVQKMTAEDDCLDLKHFCRKIKEIHGRGVTLNGYCQGGFTATIAILSGELDDLVDALITCAASMDDYRRGSRQFQDLGDYIKCLDNGNKVVDGSIISCVHKLKSIENETSSFVLERLTQDKSLSGDMALAFNHWLTYGWTDLPVYLAQLSFESNRRGVDQKGTLPVKLFGRDLNFKHIAIKRIPWLICYGQHDGLVGPDQALAPLDYIDAEVAAFPKGHVAIATSWSHPDSDFALHKRFADGVTRGPVRFQLDLPAILGQFA
jgi:tetratricopeptide (TPR) repeat protein